MAGVVVIRRRGLYGGRYAYGAGDCYGTEIIDPSYSCGPRILPVRGGWRRGGVGNDDDKQIGGFGNKQVNVNIDLNTNQAASTACIDPCGGRAVILRGGLRGRGWLRGGGIDNDNDVQAGGVGNKQVNINIGRNDAASGVCGPRALRRVIY